MKHILLSILIAAGVFTMATPAAESSKTHTILIKGFQFQPERLEVAVGDIVIWKNEDIVPHTATAKKGFDSKNLDRGQSWKYVAKQKGAFNYICTFHPSMKAVLVVK